MGRNFFSVCDLCEVQLMHFRGEEGKTLHRFANDHSAHKGHVRVIDDYVEEPNIEYTDMFVLYNPETEVARVVGAQKGKKKDGNT